MARKSKEMQPQETLRFSDSELAKLTEVHERALKNSRGCASKTQVLKELLGLMPMTVITDADRNFLLTRDSVLTQAPGGRKPSA